MVLDMREIPYIDAFMQVRDAVNLQPRNEEVLVFVDADEHEKCLAIKGFAEVLLECKTAVMETGGYYIVQIIRELADEAAAGRQKNIGAAA